MNPLADAVTRTELEQLQLMREVDISVAEPLLRRGELITVARGECVIEAGKVNCRLYLLLAGRLEVRLQPSFDRPVRTVEVGEMVGELSVVDGLVTSASVVAATPSRLLAMDAALLWRLADAAPTVYRNLLQAMSGRLRFLNQIVGAEDRRASERAPAVEQGQVASQQIGSRFDDIAGLSSDLIWEIDAELRFTYVSEKLNDIAAIDPSGCLGKRWQELADSEQNSAAADELQTSLAARRQFRDIGYRLTDAHGEQRNLTLSGKPIFDNNGQFHGFRGIGVDMTLQRQAMERVQAVENRFVSAVEAMSEGFALFDAEDKLVYCNAALLERAGPMVHLIVPGISFAESTQNALNHGLVAEAEGREEEWLEQRIARHRQASGHPFELRVGDSRWIRNQEHRTVDGGTVTISTDISELKLHAIKAAEAHAQLQDVIESLSEGLAVTDPEGRLVVVNQRARELFPDAAAVIEPGARFEDVVRTLAGKGYYRKSGDDIEALVTRRMAQHNSAPCSHEMTLPGGQWYQVNERPTEAGGIVTTWTDITELKRREQALKESEERFRNLIEGSIQGILIHRDWKPLFVNQAWADILGFESPQEVLAMEQLAPLYAEHERERLWSYQAARMRGESAPSQYDFDAVRKDGAPLALQCVVSMATWDSEPAIQVAVIDITDRKRAERALSEAHAQLSDVIESLSEGLLMTDRDERIALINQRAYELFPQVTSFAKTGVPFQDVVRWLAQQGHYGSKDSDAVEQIVDQRVALRNDAPCSHEMQVRSGQWLQVNERPTQNGGIVTTWTDITELKQREAALQRSEERYTLAMRGANEGLWDWLVESETVHLSPHACRVLAVDETRTTLTIEQWQSHLHANDLERWRDAFVAHLRGATPYFREEVRIADAAGQERWIFVHGLGLRDESGRVYRMAGSVGDVTERRQLEAKARQQELQLLQANKMTALGTLVSGVAHEINNPNNLILMNAQLLTEIWRDANPILRAYANDHDDLQLAGLSHVEMLEAGPTLISDISDGAQRIEKIVSDLKDFAQPREKAQHTRLEINSVVKTSAALLKHVIQKKTERFELSLGESLPRINGDAQRLEQVLINLLVNALDALPNRHCGVKVTTRHNSEDQRVEVRVQDDGNGIPEELLERIFDPFFTTKQSSGGTGLGLAICYTLIKEHRGTIGFESEPGSGTTAVIRLPLGVDVGTTAPG